MIYFHRWFRLATPAGFCMLLSMYAFKYWGDGPKYYQSWIMGRCDKTWWASILFIQNVIPWEAKNMCMGWFWYLANDFEFFLISPIIIFIYCKSRYAGYAALAACFLTNFIWNMAITAKYDFGIFVTIADKADYMHWMYLKPWTRFSAYGVGALFGWAYFEYKTRQKNPQFNQSVWTKMFMSYKISTLVAYVSFLVGIFLTTFLVFIQYSFYKNHLEYNNWDKFPAMMYNAFSRAGFVLGLTLIILPTFEGRLPWIKTFLGSDFMCVLGRLTFGVYLMHIPWINVFLADLRQGVWVNNLNQWWL